MNGCLTRDLGFTPEVALQITYMHGYTQRNDFAMAIQEEIKSTVSMIWKTLSNMAADQQIKGIIPRIAVGQQFALHLGFFAHYCEYIQCVNCTHTIQLGFKVSITKIGRFL